MIKDAINEINELLLQAKQAESVASKGQYMALVYMNVLFMIVYTIPILYSFIVLCGIFYYGPIVLLGLLFSIPFILFVFLVKTKLYPVMKSNLLNGDSVSK
ncbi:hypothetical protein [Mesobacillus jeotgali]|uniref:hypothetical protein n=1 Tax=Mesobacillus jeotgali TaxID=129985 RepID=UPI0009A86778|nr:hypothetical protein [Mesobacillus jeotgali]